MKLAKLVALSQAMTIAYAQSQFYADGGYTGSKTPCFEGWVYKIKKGTNKFETVVPSSICVSFDELQPGIDENDLGPLLDPTDPRTNTGLWCSTRDIYNPTANNEDNIKQWGYCLEESNVQVTSAPTSSDEEPATSVPTVSQTSEPTSSDEEPETSAPTITETPAPTAEEGGVQYFADGGYLEEPTPCYPNWQWKEKKGTNKFDLITPSGTCVPFTELLPVSSEELGTLNTPTDANTDLLSWCPTIDIYNPSSENTDNLKSWGYCLTKSSQATGSPSESEQTSAPTASQATSEPTESEATSSPTTSLATSEPTETGETDSPTAPTTSSPTSSRPGPQGNQIGGSDPVNPAAIAVPVVLIILIAAAVVGAVMYKKNKNKGEALPITKSGDDGGNGPQDTSDKKAYSPIKFFNQAASKSAASLRNLTQSFTNTNNAEPMSEPLHEPLQKEEHKVEIQGGVAPEAATTQPEPTSAPETAQTQPEQSSSTGTTPAQPTTT